MSKAAKPITPKSAGVDPGFVHLHVQSAYSLLQGSMTIAKLAELAKADHQPAVALTDNDNMFGALEFSDKMASSGVQPITGCAMAVDFGDQDISARNQLVPARIVLLAMNEDGYRSLMKFNSRAFMETPINEAPRIKAEWLDGETAGLIALTGGPDGPISQALLADQPALAHARFDRLKALFGDRLYVELQRHGVDAERRCESTLIDLAYSNDVPLVATNQPYFASADDYEAHDALLCIAGGRLISETDRHQLTPDHRFKTRAEMAVLFADLPEALASTVEIAKRCSFRPLTRKPILPRFTVVGSANSADAESEEGMELRRQAQEGLAQRLKAHGLAQGVSEEDYRARLAFEIDVITRMNYSGYFLIVADFIQWAKAEGIPVGPGRGSGAGSLVAYALTVTDLDPIRFGLLFERFLNPERISMPDIDLDFDERRRSEMIAYATNKYGEDRVAQIITYSNIKSKQALKDATRVLGYPYAIGDKITKALPPTIMGKDITLSGVFDPKNDRYGEAGEFRSVYETDADAKRIVDTARGLEGLKRQWGVHAAGVILSKEPLLEVIPIHRRESDGAIITQFDMGACEATGLLKMDFLGLRNLSVLDDCLINIQRNQGKTIILEDLTLDDPKTFELLGKGETLGVFQLDGGPMRALLRQMSPDSFEDISAVIALYRPGPMGVNAHTDYADRKNRRKPVEPIHEELSEPLSEILGDTYGLIVYQEQVMAIAQKVAGFSLGRADLLRKAMGKKNKEILDKEYVNFEAGMTSGGFGKAAIKKLWDTLIPFSDYAFNRAHSAGYGLVSYWTAYLKANYPTEYMAALLTSVRDDKDKSALYLNECRRMGIKVLPPDVNESASDYTPLGSDIRFGLTAIRNVGENVVSSIVANRQNKGRFTSFGDFLAKVDQQVCNKKTIESLIKAGAFDSLGASRRGLMMVYLEAIDSVSEAKRAEAIGQFDLFGATDESAATSVSGVELDIPTEEWEKSLLLSYEREMLGLYVSDHPLLGIEHVLRAAVDMPLSQIAEDSVGHEQIVNIGGLITQIQRKVSKQGNSWAIVSIEDLEGAVDVLFFAATYQAHALNLIEDRVIVVRGRIDKREEAPRITALDMTIPDVTGAPTGPLVISMDANRVTPPLVDRMKEILRSHPGPREVHLKLDDGTKGLVMKIDDDLRVTASPSLSADLKSVLGPDCLVL